MKPTRPDTANSTACLIVRPGFPTHAEIDQLDRTHRAAAGFAQARGWPTGEPGPYPRRLASLRAGGNAMSPPWLSDGIVGFPARAGNGRRSHPRRRETPGERGGAMMNLATIGSTGEAPT